MPTRKAEPRCGAVIEWRQFQGMLMLTAAGYSGRCPVSHRGIVQKKQPRLGATCGLPATMCRELHAQSRAKKAGGK